MRQFYTLTLTPTEREALEEFIEINHNSHVKLLRERANGNVRYTRFERAVNKIINSKSVAI